MPFRSGRRKRSPARMFVVFAVSLAIALLSGANWIGEPLRWVRIFTLVAAGMSAGVALQQAIAALRETGRTDGNGEAAIERASPE